MTFEECELSWNHLSDVSPLLVAFPKLEYLRLEMLDLSMGTLSDRGARALLAAPGVARLKRLVLSDHYISNAVAEELRKLPCAVELDELQGADTPEDDRSCAVSE